MRFFKDFFDFFYTKNNSKLTPIANKQEFYNNFSGKTLPNDEKLTKAYEKAWDARKFEIDNYWKRTTYFWAFQITAFTAYLAVLNSTFYRTNTKVLFCIISIGFITSMSWVLINIGSKFWQRHWEKYIDMLEDEITGPLYKTIYAYKSARTFSVSKLNEMISRFFVVIWIIFAVKYCITHLTFSNEEGSIAYIEIIAMISTISFTFAMFKGYGRGNFGSADFKYYTREVFK